MITAGKLMQADPDLANPTILIIVDRIDLEGQMEGQLEALGLQDAQVVKSRRELEDTLRSDRRGIILSMIHKFDEMPAALCNRDNVVVLIDEVTEARRRPRHVPVGGACCVRLTRRLAASSHPSPPPASSASCWWPSSPTT